MLLLVGFGLFVWCVGLFVRVGRGTLAPWDPTRRLVVVGPYRYMRNPMITGVATMLAAQALAAGSRVVAGWFALFVLFNHLYFMLVEEPGLVRRFGASYEEYRGEVPRWLPRTTPWRPSSSSSSQPAVPAPQPPTRVDTTAAAAAATARSADTDRLQRQV
jgi:protein-S-isoprenylcysteine O-methyltransferase Ste14